MPVTSHESDHPQFKLETIREIFKLSQSDPNTRVNEAALQLSAEYLRLFTTEALHRSAEMALKDKAQSLAAKTKSASNTDSRTKGREEDLSSDGTILQVSHLKRIAAGLLLDF